MICSRCKLIEECDYFDDRIKPIEEAIRYGEDDFSVKVKSALDEFECEYFEQED